MYSVCYVEAAPKPAGNYEFFTYKGQKPVILNYRGQEIKVTKGTEFGVRPSSSGKDIRLVFPDNVNRVLTLTPQQAQDLARGVK